MNNYKVDINYKQIENSIEKDFLSKENHAKSSNK